MIFGNKVDFAIEASVEEGLKPPSAVWGRLCIWCYGKPIGDYEEPYCALYPTYQGFLNLKSNIDNLKGDNFSKLSAKEVWNLLDGALYGYHGSVEIEDNRTLEEIEREWSRFHKYDFITNWGEQFDREGKSFVYESEAGKLNILNYKYFLRKKIAFSVSKLSVLDAIDNFTKWFDEQVDRLNKT